MKRKKKGHVGWEGRGGSKEEKEGKEEAKNKEESPKYTESFSS